MRSLLLSRFGLGFLLCSLLLPAAAQAQTGSISGMVRSADTGAPIVAALVQVTTDDGDRVASTLTNQTGRYQINVGPGSYRVLALFTGFETGEQTIQVTAGSTATANFDLASRTYDLDPLVVSASRRQERALDAPARTEVVAEEEIAARPVVTPVDHLRSVPGIDIATSGVQTTNVVARGFNNIFSGALYTLTDHRIAGVPSLRVNLMHLVPSTNEDLERIEVVLGPGSALYGPGTANGVLHMITRSPLLEQGTTFSLTGGERSLFHGTFRTAHLLSENFGVKLSGQYLRADEWEYVDPVERSEASIYATNPLARQQLIAATGITPAEADARIARIGQRDNDVTRWGGELRADWRVTPELGAVFSLGTTTSNGIELTGLGAGQAVDWRYSYAQARATWGDAFAQFYVNATDSGDTYLLRNGAPIADRSKLFVGQLQHTANTWGGRQTFTYGADLLYTLPETEGTINGAYEADDETTEIGGYLQSETSLTPQFDLILAGRLDSHSALPDLIFSPRAAVVFKPSQDQSLRLSFNRAFSTPTSLNQFLDLGSPIPNEDAARLGYSLRIQGTGDRGFRFQQDGGGYQIRSPFTPGADGPAQLLPASQATMFWPAAVQVVAASSPVPIPPQMVQYLMGLQNVPVSLNAVNPEGNTTPVPLSQLALPDVAPIRESTSNTIELGYKGILGERVLLAADVWWAKRENLVTPLTIATPFVHLDAGSATQYLGEALVPFFVAAGRSPEQAQQEAQATAGLLGPGLAAVPLGVISSPDVNANGAQLLVTYFNVDDDLDLYGVDLAATALITPEFTLEGSVSLVSDDVFQTRRGQRVTLNAPKTKGTLAGIYRRAGFHGEARLRYNDAYPVDSGVFKATECLGDAGDEIEPCVGNFTLLDLTLGYDLPQVSGVSVQLTVQNLLGEDYRSFPGSPEIGRMALLRLRYGF